MLTEPASKASVPFTVVMRRRSITPASVIAPDEEYSALFAAVASINIPASHHVFEPSKFNCICPLLTNEADGPFITTSPVV